MANRLIRGAAGVCAAVLVGCAVCWMSPAAPFERAAADVLPNTVTATQTDLQAGDFVYTLRIDGSIEITAYVGTATAITVPPTLDGFPVTSIGRHVFMDKADIVSVALPDGLLTIGENAFSNCRALTAIQLPDTVTTLGNYAFSNCSALATAILSASLAEIPAGCFTNCIALESLYLPDGVIALGRRAFAGCSSLAILTLPAALTAVDGTAFTGCTALSRVTVPDSLTADVLNALVFDATPTIRCHRLAYADLWAQAQGFPVVYLDEPDLSQLQTLFLPASLAAVEAEAFSGVAAEAVVLPDGCASVGARAFALCPNLRYVQLPGGLSDIDATAFEGCTMLTILTPDGSAAAAWADARGIPHQDP